ncbi:Glucose--fructose oxidoreductase [Candidatus Calditenuaceae archaeon HR02]|nr:Glucose--fructose oxidoreductase [Candidatus Calditenuaceae archaeon HR02]
MTKKLKLCVAGLVHDHVWGLLDQFGQIGSVEIVAAADYNPPLLERASNLYGIRRIYRDFSEMFEKEEVDIALVCNENARHADVVELAAENGIHVIMEKPMAANLSQARRIVSASERHGVKVLVNYPTTWNPGIQYSLQLTMEGKIGDIFHIRYRGAHAGPREVGCSPYFYRWLYDKELNGAGALMDYCCYGVNITLWFLDKLPSRVWATAKNLVRKYIPVEDNAILLMEFDDAIGVAEASWSQIGSYPIHGPIINGSDGTIIVTDDGKVHVWQVKNSSDFRDIRSESIKPPTPPKGYRNGPEYFVQKVLQDEEIEKPLNAKFNMAVQEVLEAGLQSVERGTIINLPL